MRILISILLFLQLSWAGINISGKVKTAEGQIPTVAHAHISLLGNSVYQPFATKKIDSDGQFTFDVEQGKFYTLFITAADHYGLQIPVLYDNDLKSIHLEIQLEPYRYNEDLNDVKVIGDWNNFKFGTASDMIKQDDGTYLFEVKSDSQKVAYQLYNLESNGHSINGTNNSELEYDGGGDYRSFVTVKNGIARIIFDPGKLYRTDKDLPVIDFGNNPALAVINGIQKNFSEESAKNRQYKATVKDGSKYDWSGMNALLQKYINSESQVVKRFTATVYASMVYEGFEMADAGKILDIIPITDPLWEMDYYEAYDFLKSALGKEKADAYINKNFNLIESRKVKAGLLAMQGLDAKADDNMILMTEIFNKLDTEYKDISEISYFRDQLNTSMAISKGKKVPDFEVKLIHSNETVSSESMLGKFYLLDFWAVWCGPCRREMPNMHKVYKEFSSKNFTILSLSFDPKLEAVDKYREEKWEMPWLHTFVEKGFNNDLSKRFEVSGIPKPVLVNPQGVIIATGMELRGEELRKTLDKYLNTTM
jgi:thiol-disulfide isomerase/thioredoxin